MVSIEAMVEKKFQIRGIHSLKGMLPSVMEMIAVLLWYFPSGVLALVPQPSEELPPHNISKVVPTLTVADNTAVVIAFLSTRTAAAIPKESTFVYIF